MKYFLAAFGSDPRIVDGAVVVVREAMAEKGLDLGPVDAATPFLPMTETRYYEREMGPNLVKRYQTFERLRGPEVLVQLKLTAMEVERVGSDGSGRRRVNLDPGYVFDGGLVLSTGKYSGHRLYLGSGVWGELTLHYHRGEFQALAWTYRDYLRPEVVALLTGARRARAAVLGGERDAGGGAPAGEADGPSRIRGAKEKRKEKDDP